MPLALCLPDTTTPCCGNCPLYVRHMQDEVDCRQHLDGLKKYLPYVESLSPAAREYFLTHMLPVSITALLARTHRSAKKHNDTPAACSTVG